VFLISVFDSATATRCPDPLLPVSEGVQWHPSTSNQARQTTPSEVAASFGSGSFGGWTATDTAITLSQRDHKGSMTMVVGSLAARDYKGVGNQYVDEGKVIAYETQDPVLMRQREGKPGGGKGPLLSNDKSLTLAGSNDQTLFTPIGFSHTQGLSAQPSEAAWPTLRTEGNGMAVLNHMAVRRLTPLECERLMGWPDGWTAGQSDTHRYKQCGNGIASPVAQWIAQQLLQLDKEPYAPPTTTTT
jgi:site-specific DNA-cytosine methylase